MRMANERSTARTRSGSEGTSDRALDPVRIRLLGGFEVSVGSRTIGKGEWPLRKAANLLKLLALASGHRMHREEAMDLLWPDSGRKGASNNLRRTLYTARRAIDKDGGSRYLASERGSLVLCPGGPLWVDVEAFEEAAAGAKRARNPAACRAALDLYGGDLLPEDRYEGWAEERRRELRQTYLSLILDLAAIQEERGEHERGVEVLRRAVAEEPALEEAHAGLMRLYAHLGREGEALAQYERLRVALSEQLGTEPSTATNRMRDEISSSGFPAVPSPVPGARQEAEPPNSPGHNLPAPRTSFVGREREMLEVKRELAMTRLLTLTGTGGSGKTRLALEVARELVGAYPDGVWLAELAPLSEGELVPQTVAQALGVKERPGEQLTDTLVEFLRARHTLLVLDNCEHLVEAVAQLVDILLDACPRLRLLATSREALGIAGEMRQLVHPLSVPDPSQQLKAEELERYESVRLFVERATYRNSAFVLAEQNVQSVAQICDRLDGIPLAIELAAARVGVPVEQIASRLDDSLGLLTTGSRTATARQRTLKGTLDWSYDLLSEPEQGLFGRLSVFAGGWTLEASEAVAPGEGTKKSEVLDLLLGLVDKSLVVAEASGRGIVRYRMLEPVRQYALEELEASGEAEALRRRHASFFLALTEEAEPELQGSEEPTWLERLEAEHDNLRAALSWTLERGEAELGLQIAGALRPFWEAHGHYGEGRRWVEEALEQGGRVSAAVRAKGLQAVCWIAVAQKDFDRAGAAAEEGLKLSDQAGLGGAAAASFLRTSGWMAEQRGDHERAKRFLEGSLRLSRQADNKLEIAYSLLELGITCGSLGDSAREQELHEEGLALSRDIGYAAILAGFLLNGGYRSLLEGDYEQASALNEEAAVLLRERGYRGGLEVILDNQGWAALLQDNHDRARTYYAESLTLCKELGDRMIAAESLEGLACISVAEGDARRAAKLFGAAETLREAVGFKHTPEEVALREPYLAASSSLVSEEVWAEVWAEGKTMDLHRAVGYALAEENRAARAPSTPEQPSAGARPPALTRREREVANLVAQGLTNRQIAKQLVVSERTVDHHVSRILRKLNVGSRERVASRLNEH